MPGLSRVGRYASSHRVSSLVAESIQIDGLIHGEAMDRNCAVDHLSDRLCRFRIGAVALEQHDAVRPEDNDFEFDIFVVTDEVKDIGRLFSQAIEGPNDFRGNLGGYGFAGQYKKNFFTVSLQQSIRDWDVMANEMLDKVMRTDKFAVSMVNDRHRAFLDPASESFVGNTTDICRLLQAEILKIARRSLGFHFIAHDVATWPAERVNDVFVMTIAKKRPGFGQGGLNNKIVLIRAVDERLGGSATGLMAREKDERVKLG